MIEKNKLLHCAESCNIYDVVKFCFAIPQEQKLGNTHNNSQYRLNDSMVFVIMFL